MPTLLTPAPVAPTPVMPRRIRWTRAECATMESVGLFDQRHYELVEGELIDKMGKNRPHVNSMVLVMAWLQQVFGVACVNPEAPIDVAASDNTINEPEPDIIVLNRGLSNFLSGNPRPEDLRLVVEVSDSTLHFDLTTKATVYARAAIAEYWVLDVAGRGLIVHRNPVGGKYETVTVYSENESVSPLAAPDAEFRAAYAFPA